jgi:protein-tyrosine phosphatase
MDREKPATILFVCTGNTCRSPMAEAIARKELDRRGWNHVAVASAGVAAFPDEPASLHARLLARQRGTSLDEHRSRSIDEGALEGADWVLTMTPTHLERVMALNPPAPVDLLGSFDTSGQGGGVRAIPDPYGMDLAAYEATWDTLEPLVIQALERFSPRSGENK